MKAGKAFIAGIVGGFAMTLLMVLGRALGMKANAEMMLGTMFGGQPGAGTWVLGLLVHLMLSGLIALGYSVGFEYMTRRAGLGIGVAFSIPHAIIGGLVMGMIPAVHPMIPEMMPAPGAFMANMGALYVVAFFVEHMLYGGIVGAIYQPALHEAKAIGTPQGRPTVA